MNRGEPLAVRRHSWVLVLALQPAHRDMKSRRQRGGNASSRPDSFDDEGFLGLVSVWVKLQVPFKRSHLIPCTHFANQTVS
jgi:hypothetical protein